jgi:hypothetical protein
MKHIALTNKRLALLIRSVTHSAESGQFFFVREETEELYKMVEELKQLKKKPKIICDEKFWLGDKHEKTPTLLPESRC